MQHGREDAPRQQWLRSVMPLARTLHRVTGQLDHPNVVPAICASSRNRQLLLAVGGSRAP
jgi:hypothetical protein